MDAILVLDSGVQIGQAIAKSIRAGGVYSEVRSFAISEDELRGYKGVILAQAPEGNTAVSGKLAGLGVPVLGPGPESLKKASVDEFIFKICGCKKDWNIGVFIEKAIADIKEQAGDKPVLCALSGGVDSSVSAVLTSRAVGDRLTCIFVDHGLMRKDEGDMVERLFRDRFHINLIRVNCERRFLDRLKGVTEPERKRKIIGEEFIRVFEEEARKLGQLGYLAQGTIYPDIIESGVENNPGVKSHHNVGGLPTNIDFCGIIEPLRLLFKDEVRECGVALGMDRALVTRQPFPGPGLSVRVLGEVTKEKLDIVREADAIFRHEIEAAGVEAGQYFAVLTGLKSVGVKNGERSYDYTIALRCVNTVDYMTARWTRVPFEVLEKASERIVSEVEGVNRVVYDITPKPPATIEWE